MNRLFRLPWKRFLPYGTALCAAAVLVAPRAADATPYVVTLAQQGSDVVATGSGAFDLSGLTYYASNIVILSANGVNPSGGYVGSGPNHVAVDAYHSPSGPTSFGTGGTVYATTGSGDAVGLNPTSFTFPLLFVPQGYASGTALANHSTWDNASFASLGLTSGTYVWTWGTGAEQSFTLRIGPVAPVPEPMALGLFGLGLLLIGGLVTLRWRGHRRVQ